jgi:hypothetical protein
LRLPRFVGQIGPVAFAESPHSAELRLVHVEQTWTAIRAGLRAPRSAFLAGFMAEPQQAACPFA